MTEQHFFSLSFQFVKKASEKLSKMTDAFFGRLVPSEDLLLKTPNLAISLKKVTANDAKRLSIGDGPSKFKLPSSLGNIGAGEINVKVRCHSYPKSLGKDSRHRSPDW